MAEAARGYATDVFNAIFGEGGLTLAGCAQVAKILREVDVPMGEITQTLQ